MKKIISILLLLLISYTTYSQWSVNVTFSPAQSLQVIRFYDANTGYCTAPVYGGPNNIHKTTNAGQNWVDQTAGYTGMRFMSIWCISADTVFISGNNGIIIKTVNGGQNWVTIPTGDTTTQYWGIRFVNSFTGFACGSNGRVIKSTDRGLTWTPLTAPTQTSLSSIFFRNEQTGYISGYAIVIKTTDAGATWVNMNAPFFSGFENFRQIIFLDDNTGYYASDAGRIVKTTNAGVNWTLLTTGTTESMFGIYFVNMNTGYACGNNGKIIYTTDAGATWAAQSSGVTDILTSVWFTSQSTGYITTWFSKVLKTTNGGFVGVTSVSNEVPESFSLEQNYPNPFNPSTKIKFAIPLNVKSEKSNVKLVIYDVVGNEITTLVNEQLNPGTYAVTWNAVNNPSGVYFYQLKAGNYTETKRMTLVK